MFYSKCFNSISASKILIKMPKQPQPQCAQLEMRISYWATYASEKFARVRKKRRTYLKHIFTCKWPSRQKGPKIFLMKRKKNFGNGVLVGLLSVGRTYFSRVYTCQNRKIEVSYLTFRGTLEGVSQQSKDSQLSLLISLESLSKLKVRRKASEVKPEFKSLLNSPQAILIE